LGGFLVKNEKSHEAFPLVLGVGAFIHEVFFLGLWSNLVVDLILLYFLGVGELLFMKIFFLV
jgi:hypothetical protein